jgi:hypothetical protein
MSDHVARTCPGAAGQITPEAGELDRLTAAYPAFRFGCETIGRHGSCWVARRINGLNPGVHTVITADLDELRTALASHEGTGHAR